MGHRLLIISAAGLHEVHAVLEDSERFSASVSQRAFRPSHQVLVAVLQQLGEARLGEPPRPVTLVQLFHYRLVSRGFRDAADAVMVQVDGPTSLRPR